MDTINIQIGTIESVIWIAVTVLGIGFAWGTLKNDVNHIKEAINDFRKNIREHDQDISRIKGQMIAGSNSPRQLNELGKRVLNESGIKEIIDDKRQELLNEVKKTHPANPYDAEHDIEAAVSKIPNKYPSLLNQIKTGAFNTGVDIDLVLLAGSIYLRNHIFKDLGFELDDLDKSGDA